MSWAVSIARYSLLPKAHTSRREAHLSAHACMIYRYSCGVPCEVFVTYNMYIIHRPITSIITTHVYAMYEIEHGSA